MIKAFCENSLKKYKDGSFLKELYLVKTMYKKPKGRNCESKHVDDLLDAVFKNKRMSQKYYETMVVAFWGKIVGRVIEKHTQSVEVRRGVAYITLDSSALIQELMMNRSSLIALINKEVEKDVVHKIVFLEV